MRNLERRLEESAVATAVLEERLERALMEVREIRRGRASIVSLRARLCRSTSRLTLSIKSRAHPVAHAMQAIGFACRAAVILQERRGSMSFILSHLAHAAMAAVFAYVMVRVAL